MRLRDSAIGLVVFASNLLGDALRDTLDPRLRRAQRATEKLVKKLPYKLQPKWPFE